MDKEIIRKLSLSKPEIKKINGMNPSIKRDDRLIIKRLNTLNSAMEVRETITGHFDYIDETGGKGTSKAGYSRFINNMIKKLFGDSVTTLITGIELETLNAIRCKIAEIIRTGEKQNVTRKEIKRNIKEKIPIIYKTMIN